MVRECPGRPPLAPRVPTIVSARTTTTNDSTTAVEVTPDDLVSNVPTVQTTVVKDKLTRIQKIAALEEEMSDDEQSAYLDPHNMESDFYNVEL